MSFILAEIRSYFRAYIWPHLPAKILIAAGLGLLAAPIISIATTVYARPMPSQFAAVLQQDAEAGQTIFQQKCAGCHKGKTPPRGLSWEAGRIAEAVDRPSVEEPGLKIIDTAAPAASYVLKKIRREAGLKGKPMPPLQALAPAELALLESWVMGLKNAPGPAAGRPVGPATSRPGRR